jgi:malate dehydrogenase (quinone)
MQEQKRKKFSVAILGGGITGSSIFYTLSKYTNIDSIALIEKCDKIGQINSKENNNSQTLHFGDIETNYSLEKATSTKEASNMIVRYLESIGERGKSAYKKSHKMALAVGKEEIEKLETRFVEFKELFPELKLISKEEISKIEPLITQGRNSQEELKAFYSEKSYVVDFGKLANLMAEDAHNFNNNSAQIFTSQKVEKIYQQDNSYIIKTNKDIFEADVVVVAMCSHSLMFAKSLGYGKEYSIFPVGGNFYTSNKKLLNGKVYTMQNGKLPFAAVHGDPNLYNENETRFGPTANFMPFLERNNAKTFFDFLKSSANDLASINALLHVLFDQTLFTFLLKSTMSDIPLFGRMIFAKQCKKIIPTLNYKNFSGEKSKAGIRPQLMNNQTKKLQMGEVEIEGKNILFNITPSPGATACLKNSVRSTEKIIGFFEGKYSFNKEAMKSDLI